MITLHHGDCREVMATMPAESVDAIVCDPPYGLAFMNRAWDREVPGVEVWREAYRVAKPGAHLIAFGGTRTYHHLATAIEAAGFEIRDMGAWLFGTGFPKSLDVSKAIDRAAGAVRGKVRVSQARNQKAAGAGRDGTPGATRPYIEAAMRTGYHEIDDDTPITPEAQRWAGWGTALKPAHEPFVIARKPLCGTVAETVLRHGTGALNIDACRAGARWPANVAHDGAMHEHGRYFYCAKASPADREDGLEGLEPQRVARGGSNNLTQWVNGTRSYDDLDPRSKKLAIIRHNHHPTVKPTELMRYLCRMVTPPGGVVLDPFCGSGSTGRGAVLEGASFIGIDLDAEYLEIARCRINACVTPMERIISAPAARYTLELPRVQQMSMFAEV